MKSYFKIPVYCEVVSTEEDRNKVTKFFNKEILPVILLVIRDSFDDFTELTNDIGRDNKTEDRWKKFGIQNLSIIDLDQHLREMVKLKQSSHK